MNYSNSLLKKYFTFLVLSSSAILLSSCAKVSSVSTNLDPENFRNYFAPEKVRIIKSEQDFTENYKLVGMVEGDDCQAAKHLAEPNEINARTQARLNAYNMGANAIVFTGCSNYTPENDKQCLATVVCYGKAYQVEEAKTGNDQ